MRSFRDYLTEVEQEEQAQAQKASKSVLAKNSSVSTAVKYIESLEKENKLVPRGLINRIKDGNSDLKAGNESRMALAVYIISNKVKHESNSPTSKEAQNIYTKYGMEAVNPAILYTKLEQNVGGSKAVLDIFNGIESVAKNIPEAPKAEPAKAEEAPVEAQPAPAKQAAKAEPAPAKAEETPPDEEESDEEGEEEAGEEDNGEEEDTYKNKVNLDKYSGESPDDIATKIEAMRKEAIANLEKKIKPNDWRTKQIYEKAVADVSAKLNRYAKAARAQQSNFSVHPTPQSKQRAMTNAQIAYNNAESAMRINTSKFGRVENGNALQHYGQSVGETIKGAATKIKSKYDNSQVIQNTKDAVKRGMVKIGDTTNAVAAKAKEGLERGVQKYMDNYDEKAKAKEQAAQQPQQQPQTRTLPSIRDRINGVVKNVIQKVNPNNNANTAAGVAPQVVPQVAQAQTAAKANVQEPAQAQPEQPAATPTPQPVAQETPAPAPAAEPAPQKEVVGTVPTPGSNAKYTKAVSPKPKLAPIKIAEPEPTPQPVAQETPAPAPAPVAKPAPQEVPAEPAPAQEPEKEEPATPAPAPKKRVRVVKPKVQEAPAEPAPEPEAQAQEKPIRKPRTITVKPKAEKPEPTAEELEAKKVARSEAAKKAATTRKAKAAAEELKLTKQPELPLEGGEGKKPPRSQQEKDIEAEDKLRKSAAEAASKGIKRRRAPQKTLYNFGKYASVNTVNKVKDNMK